METNVQTLCTMQIIGSYTFQPLWVSDYSQLSLRQTLSGPAPTVRLREVSVL